jgi:hypothetical protein
MGLQSDTAGKMDEWLSRDSRLPKFAMDALVVNSLAMMMMMMTNLGKHEVCCPSAVPVPSFIRHKGA